MIDKFGRDIDYIRVSVTDRCNMRCQYCMPKEGVPKTGHDDILSYDEILRICSVMAQLGVRKIKLTGGEPLVRKNFVSLVRDLKSLPGIEKVTMTTNGVLLAEAMDDLAGAGIDNINISLDSLDRDVYEQITRRDVLEKVKEGLKSVLKYPEIGIKVNCVPLNRREQDLISIALLAKEHPIHVRFIEMMPIGLGRNFTFQSESEIVAQLEAEFGRLSPYEGHLGNGPGHYYAVEGFMGKIGFISAISHKFCDQCNRIRITSQGFLKSCLQYDLGVDLRTLLRAGRTQDELKEQIIGAVNQKPAGHAFLTDCIEAEEHFGMSQIGG